MYFLHHWLEKLDCTQAEIEKFKEIAASDTDVFCDAVQVLVAAMDSVAKQAECVQNSIISCLCPRFIGGRCKQPTDEDKNMAYACAGAVSDAVDTFLKKYEAANGTNDCTKLLAEANSANRATVMRDLKEVESSIHHTRDTTAMFLEAYEPPPEVPEIDSMLKECLELLKDICD